MNENNCELHKLKEIKTLESTMTDYYFDNSKIYRYNFLLKNPHIENYFELSNEEIEYYNNWQNDGLIDYLKEVINSNVSNWNLDRNFNIMDIKIEDNKLIIYFNSSNNYLKELLDKIIMEYYMNREMHITRMFGSYILLQRLNGSLRAVKATPIPIKYCPLMAKLLKEVGGETAEVLLNSLANNNIKTQTEMMCELINNIVIDGGYFDTNRPLNSCEANVLFGASETISSAFKSGMIDAAVIVSNNLGTIITTNDLNTQGAVKRMTGLFYTSPSENIVKTAEEVGIIPVYPYSAQINQLEGVKEAIRRGYKRIAVSVAANENYLHEALKQLEKDGITIYKFGLCSTGIDEKTAIIMKNNADVIWTCASKYVKEYVEQFAIAQVGIKIPVHIMTKRGWEIVKNHLKYMDPDIYLENVNLLQGNEKSVFLNDKGKIKIIKRESVKKCSDCPNPCI